MENETGEVGVSPTIEEENVEEENIERDVEEVPALKPRRAPNEPTTAEREAQEVKLAQSLCGWTGAQIWN